MGWNLFFAGIKITFSEKQKNNLPPVPGSLFTPLRICLRGGGIRELWAMVKTYKYNNIQTGSSGLTELNSYPVNHVNPVKYPEHGGLKWPRRTVLRKCNRHQRHDAEGHLIEDDLHSAKCPPWRIWGFGGRHEILFRRQGPQFRLRMDR